MDRLLLRIIFVTVLLTLSLSACITLPSGITTGGPPLINPDEVVPPASITSQQPAPKPLSLWEKLLQLLKTPPSETVLPVTVPPSEAPATVETVATPKPTTPVAAPAPEIITEPKPTAEVTPPAPVTEPKAPIADNPPVVIPPATPALTAARDLTGIWTGTGVYYQLDMVSGERLRKITVEIKAQIKQVGETVEVEMDYHAIKWEPISPISERGYWLKQLKDIKSSYTITRNLDDPIPPGYEEIKRWRVDLYTDQGDGGDTWTRWLSGNVSATTMSLETLSKGAFSGGFETWQFTFTTDLMSGGVKSIPGKVSGGTYYKGRESDPKAFNLTRQK